MWNVYSKAFPDAFLEPSMLVIPENILHLLLLAFTPIRVPQLTTPPLKTLQGYVPVNNDSISPTFFIHIFQEDLAFIKSVPYDVFGDRCLTKPPLEFLFHYFCQVTY